MVATLSKVLITPKRLHLECFCKIRCSATFSMPTRWYHFYPTALKGCWGIVFTHGVRMGRRAGGRAAGKEFVRAVSQKP